MSDRCYSSSRDGGRRCASPTQNRADVVDVAVCVFSRAKVGREGGISLVRSSDVGSLPPHVCAGAFASALFPKCLLQMLNSERRKTTH